MVSNSRRSILLGRGYANDGANFATTRLPPVRLRERTVNAALLHNNSQQINLIGHSAGGWISRIYLGEIPYAIYGDVTADTIGLWNARAKIATLITLGTPQISCIATAKAVRT